MPLNDILPFLLHPITIATLIMIVLLVANRQKTRNPRPIKDAKRPDKRGPKHSEDLNSSKGTHSCCLYIEDNKDHQELMTMIFEDIAGLDLLCVDSVRKAFLLLNQINPLFLLMDLHLPETSGLDMIRFLRRSKRYGSLPIIVVTADATRKTSDTIMAFDNIAYMTKPFDPEKLVKTIHAMSAESKKKFYLQKRKSS